MDVWRSHFEANSRVKDPVSLPWELGAALTEAERLAIASSIAEFQLGEQSEGRRLIAQAAQYPKGDLTTTIRLFIGEEHRHAGLLARYMKLANIPRRQYTPRDHLFRRFRRFNLETTLRILITAEMVATVYYPALSRATGCPLLQQLAQQIAADEVVHVQFQHEALRELCASQPCLQQRLSLLLHRWVFALTLCTVWQGHRAVLQRSGLNWGQWWQQNWQTFETVLSDQPHTVAVML
ncbi:MAG: ferritin-like domain-containing protein [Synechococcaceae cyanobacterium SM2_3_60]|nr:ferritin-like domain-containing protein [Synechococcaceae cyanobacterium SM2_3_60]